MSINNICISASSYWILIILIEFLSSVPLSDMLWFHTFYFIYQDHDVFCVTLNYAPWRTSAIHSVYLSTTTQQALQLMLKWSSKTFKFFRFMSQFEWLWEIERSETTTKNDSDFMIWNMLKYLAYLNPICIHEWYGLHIECTAIDFVALLYHVHRMRITTKRKHISKGCTFRPNFVRKRKKNRRNREKMYFFGVRWCDEFRCSDMQKGLQSAGLQSPVCHNAVATRCSSNHCSCDDDVSVSGMNRPLSFSV